MQKPLQQRYAAIFLAMLILITSIGWSSYSRFCSCAGEVYSSVFAKNEGSCCKDHAAKKEAQKAPKSCCQLKTIQKEETTCKKSDNCCHTKVKYIALDTDATLAQAALDLPNLLMDWVFSANNGAVYPSFIQNYSLSNYDKGIFLPNAPPPKSGRQLLQLIQVMIV